MVWWWTASVSGVFSFTETVTIPSVINAHSLALWPEYVLLMITAVLLWLDTMAHLKGFHFLRSYLTSSHLAAWPDYMTGPCWIAGCRLIRFLLVNVGPCPWQDVFFIAGCLPPVMVYPRRISKTLKPWNQNWGLEFHICTAKCNWTWHDGVEPVRGVTSPLWLQYWLTAFHLLTWQKHFGRQDGSGLVSDRSCPCLSYNKCKGLEATPIVFGVSDAMSGGI